MIKPDNIKAVLFDLDGTLVDTALDLIHALNLSLAQHGFNECDPQKLREAASHGSLFMAQTALPNETESQQVQVQQTMLSFYAKINGDKGKIFANLDKLLDRLEQLSIPFGVVTNKPARFTRPLMHKLGLTSRMKSVIAGDSTTVMKPELAPMLLAAQQINSKPNNILYLGDAERDILSANNAGMISAIAEWGYISKKDDIKSWNADLSFKDPLDLLALFKNKN